jgi:hypothetical protein
VNRRLWLLNLLLAALAGGAIWQLRERWMAAEQRRLEIIQAPSAAAAIAAPPAKTPAEDPVRAANYFEVAEKMLFSRDRNPAVIVEAPVEKPMPPLPNAFGVMDLGSGPVAFLALKGEPQRGYRIGETVGDFKLIAADSSSLTLEWDGKPLKRTLDELRARGPEAAVAAAVSARPDPEPNRTAPSTINATQNPGTPKFGADLGASSKYCDPEDTSPDGTVVDGYRKVLRKTPFSTTCTWEKVQ